MRARVNRTRAFLINIFHQFIAIRKTGERSTVYLSILTSLCQRFNIFKKFNKRAVISATNHARNCQRINIR